MKKKLSMILAAILAATMSFSMMAFATTETAAADAAEETMAMEETMAVEDEMAAEPVEVALGNVTVKVPADWEAMEMDGMNYYQLSDESLVLLFFQPYEEGDLEGYTTEEVFDAIEESIGLAADGAETVDKITGFTINGFEARKSYVTIPSNGVVMNTQLYLFLDDSQITVAVLYTAEGSEDNFSRELDKIAFSICAPAEEDATEGETMADETMAETEAAADGMYKDGTYTATTVGASPAGSGDVNVTVTIEGGVITAVEIDAPRDSQSLGATAIKKLPDKIIEANGIDGVNVISGCSLTSQAILDAVAMCLEEAAN